jgi:hypothetical protein
MLLVRQEHGGHLLVNQGDGFQRAASRGPLTSRTYRKDSLPNTRKAASVAMAIGNPHFLLHT